VHLLSASQISQAPR